MNNIPTPHIGAINKEDIAKIVIMPGDPLRAKFIAEKYLDNYKIFNNTRSMFGYTGYYKNKKISVMAHGMGMPSISIYAYELYNFYDVDTIIRIGTCGGLRLDLDLYDTCLVNYSYTDSNISKLMCNINKHKIKSNQNINKKLIDIAKNKNIKLNYVNAYSTDNFYSINLNPKEEIKYKYKTKCDVIEMESFALFLIADALNKNASCLLTISDTKDKMTTSEEREKSFLNMIEIALEYNI